MASAKEKARVQRTVVKDGKDMTSFSARRIEKAIRAMRDPLVIKYREMQVLLEESVGNTARVRHQIGIIVVDVMGNVDRYGEHGVALLATALGRNADTLYEWARVAETWTAPALGALLERRTVQGMPLSISHLVLLSSIRDGVARSAATEQALTAGLSVKRLRGVIDGQRDAQAHIDDGTLAGRRLLSRLNRSAGIAVRSTARIVSSLERLPDDEIMDPEFVELLSRGVVKTRQMVKDFGAVVDRLEARLLGLARVDTVSRRSSRSRTA